MFKKFTKLNEKVYIAVDLDETTNEVEGFVVGSIDKENGEYFFPKQLGFEAGEKLENYDIEEVKARISAVNRKAFSFPLIVSTNEAIRKEYKDLVCDTVATMVDAGDKLNDYLESTGVNLIGALAKIKAGNKDDVTEMEARQLLKFLADKEYNNLSDYLKVVISDLAEKLLNFKLESNIVPTTMEQFEVYSSNPEAAEAFCESFCEYYGGSYESLENNRFLVKGFPAFNSRTFLIKVEALRDAVGMETDEVFYTAKGLEYSMDEGGKTIPVYLNYIETV